MLTEVTDPTMHGLPGHDQYNWRKYERFIYSTTITNCIASFYKCPTEINYNDFCIRMIHDLDFSSRILLNKFSSNDCLTSVGDAI